MVYTTTYWYINLPVTPTSQTVRPTVFPTTYTTIKTSTATTTRHFVESQAVLFDVVAVEQGTFAATGIITFGKATYSH